MSNVTDSSTNGDLDGGTAGLQSVQARLARKKVDRTSVDTAFKGFCLTREQQKGTQRNVTFGTNFYCSDFWSQG